MITLDINTSQQMKPFLWQDINLHLVYGSSSWYRGADKFLARPGRKQVNISVRMAWISFGTLPCKKKKNLMTAHVSVLLKSRPSLKCFRACFLPGRAKDSSEPRVLHLTQVVWEFKIRVRKIRFLLEYTEYISVHVIIGECKQYVLSR